MEQGRAGVVSGPYTTHFIVLFFALLDYSVLLYKNNILSYAPNLVLLQHTQTITIVYLINACFFYSFSLTECMCLKIEINVLSIFLQERNKYSRTHLLGTRPHAVSVRTRQNTALDLPVQGPAPSLICADGPLYRE